MSYFCIKLMMIIMILVNVAFITLLERKVLGYIQNRKGPNKLGMMGILQPISDALKLFFKEVCLLIFSNKFIYIMAPMISLFLMMLYWGVIFLRMSDALLGLDYEFIFLILISSMSVYAILLSGWSSNSKYALLGSYRGVAQVISYEVSFSFIVMGVFVFCGSLQLMSIIFIQVLSWSVIFSMVEVLVLWLVVIMAELNRTPFDLSEGESELVSGFNIEYGGFLFAIIFMAEYGMILFMSWLTVVMFLSSNGFIMMLMVVLVLIIRGTLVRYRYDKLMMLSWKVILPYVLMILMVHVLVLCF